jgi:DNA transformation protein
MFGGTGFFLHGVMFALWHRDALHFRVDDATRPEYEAEDAAPFEPRPGVRSRTWFAVPARILEDDDLLVAWARRSVKKGSGDI